MCGGRDVLAADANQVMITVNFRITFFPASIGMPAKSGTPLIQSDKPISDRPRARKLPSGAFGEIPAYHWPAANSCLGREWKLCR